MHQYTLQVSYQQEQELQVKEKERLRTEREEKAKRKELEKKHQEEIQVIKEQVSEVKQVEIPASDSKKDFKITFGQNYNSVLGFYLGIQRLDRAN